MVTRRVDPAAVDRRDLFQVRQVGNSGPNGITRFLEVPECGCAFESMCSKAPEMY